MHRAGEVSRCANRCTPADCYAVKARHVSEALLTKNSALPVILSRVSRRGKSDSVQWIRCPGIAASSKILPFQGRMGSAEFANWGASLRFGIAARDSSRVPVRNDLPSRCFGICDRETAVRNIRDNNAARVAGPGRICFFVNRFTAKRPSSVVFASAMSSILLICHSHYSEGFLLGPRTKDLGCFSNPPVHFAFCSPIWDTRRQR